MSKATKSLTRKLGVHLFLVAMLVSMCEYISGWIAHTFSAPYADFVHIGLLLAFLGPVFHFILFRPVIRVSKERDQAEEQFRKSKEDERALIEAIEEGIIRMDRRGRCVFANNAAIKMLGYEKEEDLLGKDIHDTIHHSSKDGEKISKEDCSAHQVFVGGGQFKEEEILWRKDGSSFPAEFRSYPIFSEERVAGAMIVFNDVSEKQAREEKIRRLAFFDVLTGLPNRETLQDRMKQALMMAERNKQHVAVMFLDLDRFKRINDSLGHDFGDELLKSVARTLKNTVRKSDTVARLGGDEFVVLLPFLDGPGGATVVARKILDRFNEPFVINGKEIHTATSIGIAMYPENGSDGAALLKSADAAMYHAKNNGRRHYKFFSKDISDQIEKRVAMEEDLRQAVEYDQLQLHYQPQFDTKKGCICGVEALLRWEHPQKGFIPPNEFIPIAEESGLILDIGSQVLAKACTQLFYWNSGPLPDIKMAINISSAFFSHPDFIKMLEMAIKATNIPRGYLDLEINEKTVMDIASTDILQKLIDLDVHLSIDDFGTGYSSLTYLKDFPISKIKIDKSFVHGITGSDNGAIIVQTIIAMSHALGLRTIAEGVEDMSQVNFLCKHKCNELQGYLFARPMPAEEAEDFMINWRKPDISPCANAN
ncbi:putative bifunctional diguanylate cyclase/phosphodiesterase [Geoalkalibacter subterraneus]|uniref:putative bifunctional diguanylate cyclase/phosphodiesterase n=1 Tax=Geoalkalibacter subterraneus TaxID=483547 RepID=UPI000693A4E5|nr:EAL domain-containing protein [Geoalkalibacter subterraneus]